MNPDIRMTEPMEALNEHLPEHYQHVQQFMMDHYSAVDNVLDPQLAWLVRNMAYQRALIVKQQTQIDALIAAVNVIAEEVFDERP